MRSGEAPIDSDRVQALWGRRVRRRSVVRRRRQTGCNMIIACARRGTPRAASISMYVFLPSSPREVKGGRVAGFIRARYAPMPELCLSYAPRCRGPRSPLAASGQRSAHPLPSQPRPLFSSSYSPESTDLLSRVVSPSAILVRRGRTDVAASPSRGVGGMQVYATSVVPMRPAGQTGSSDRFSARSLASGGLRSSLKTSRGKWRFSRLSSWISWSWTVQTFLEIRSLISRIRRFPFLKTIYQRVCLAEYVGRFSWLIRVLLCIDFYIWGF